MSDVWVREDVPRGTETAISGCAVSGRAVSGDATVCGCEETEGSTIIEVDLQVTGTIEVISG